MNYFKCNHCDYECITALKGKKTPPGFCHVDGTEGCNWIPDVDRQNLYETNKKILTEDEMIEETYRRR